MDTPATRLTLLALLQAEDTNDVAWNDFVGRYGPKVAEWCRQQRLLPNQVEELTQDVLVNLFHHIRTFQYDPQKGKFRAYLRTITRNAIGNWRKRAARAHRQPDGEALADLAAQDDLLVRLERDFDIERLHLVMRSVQKRIEVTTWQAFQATELAGRRAAAVGSELGLSVAAVNVYRSRVRAMIRDELERSDEHG